MLSNGQSKTSKNPEKYLDQNSLLNPPGIELCQPGEPREKHMYGGLGRGYVVPWLCPKNTCMLKFLLHIVAVSICKLPQWGGGRYKAKKMF